MQAKWGFGVLSQPSLQRAWKSPACFTSTDRPSVSETTGLVSASVKLTFTSCSVSHSHYVCLGNGTSMSAADKRAGTLLYWLNHFTNMLDNFWWDTDVVHWEGEHRKDSAVTWCLPADRSVLVECTLLWLVCESKGKPEPNTYAGERSSPVWLFQAGLRFPHRHFSLWKAVCSVSLSL